MLMLQVVLHFIFQVYFSISSFFSFFFLFFPFLDSDLLEESDSRISGYRKRGVTMNLEFLQHESISMTSQTASWRTQIYKLTRCSIFNRIETESFACSFLLSISLILSSFSTRKSTETPPLAMALKSDISIDTSKFDPAAISEQTLTFNQHLLDIFEGVPKWYEVSLELFDLSWSEYVPWLTVSRSAPRNTAKCGSTAKLQSLHQNHYPKLWIPASHHAIPAGPSPAD